ncbi:MAG: FAD-dependent oxidoreductase [Clostridiaceae bacterium]|nr:FAD-dependent oxidoreductase [Clostridiaceae bacterium]
MKNKEIPFNDTFQEAPNSFWLASTEITNYPSLYENIETEVAIIGGGIAGITVASLLKREGLKVVLIEANRITQGTTAHTTAKITSQHDLTYTTLVKKMGEEKARMYGESNQSAISLISDIIKENQISCDFSSRPAYIFTEDEEYLEKIKAEVKTAKNLGLPASFTETLQLPLNIKGAIRFDNQAQFHPRKYLLALAKSIPLNGSYIFENTRVLDIEQGKKLTLITNQNKKVTAEKVIICSHFPFYDGLGFYFTRIHTSRSYIIGIKTKEKIPDGMFKNAENPTLSLRTQKYEDGEMLLIVGADHKTGENKDTTMHYTNLINYAKETFKMEKLLYRWSTQDCMTLDNVPYIGNLTSKTPNIYVATGFGKWGMTHGTLSAMIISDLIVKGKSPYEELYSPSRFTPVASAENFVIQNLDVAKKFIGGKIAPVPNNVDIPIGNSKIIEAEAGKFGAYRDQEENLHLVNLTCTHMGCSPVWNSAEKSWDCPCHGSRFSYKGDILEGPAHEPLMQLHEGPNKVEPNIIP